MLTTVIDEALSPKLAVAAVPVTSPDAATAAALEGATEVNRPKPNAATVTSAMRLKVVFVDICFLSISHPLDDPGSGFG